MAQPAQKGVERWHSGQRENTSRCSPLLPLARILSSQVLPSNVLILKIHFLPRAFRPFNSSTRHHVSFALNASNSAPIASIHRSQSSWLNASCSVSGSLDTCGMYSSERWWLLPWIGRSQSLFPVVCYTPTATSFECDGSAVYCPSFLPLRLTVGY